MSSCGMDSYLKGHLENVIVPLMERMILEAKLYITLATKAPDGDRPLVRATVRLVRMLLITSIKFIKVASREV